MVFMGEPVSETLCAMYTDTRNSDMQISNSMFGFAHSRHFSLTERHSLLWISGSHPLRNMACPQGKSMLP